MPDAFALRSHQNALRAQEHGHFDDEIVPVEVETVGRQDTGRASSSATKARAPTPRLEALAKLKPVFHAKGTVTAGNSSQTSDGAAAALVMSRRRRRGSWG